jgi:uncharacterized membrane protein
VKHPLSKTQIACVILLWAVIMFIIIRFAERVDGPTILTLLLASAFIFVPIYKSIQKKK